MSGDLFPGPGITCEADEKRILTHNERIWELMLGRGKWWTLEDSKWWTLREMELVTGFPQASISAAFRSFRREKFGSHTVEREYNGDGVFVYRLIPNLAGVRADGLFVRPVRKKMAENG